MQFCCQSVGSLPCTVRTRRVEGLAQQLSAHQAALQRLPAEDLDCCQAELELISAVLAQLQQKEPPAAPPAPHPAAPSNRPPPPIFALGAPPA